MSLVPVAGVGSLGVNKDISQHELPVNVWTDANNIRFLDGSASQVLGYKDLYPSPAVIPYHILPLNVLGVRYWIYASDKKIYTVANGPVHTNITRQTAGVDVDYSATHNSWTSSLLGGIPILNNGVDVPQQWLLTGKAAALTAWPATYTCAVMRTYKNSLIALNITKAGVNYPFMVKWSHPADPGTVPVTWDITDASKDAGEADISDGYDKIIDGLVLRDSFMIYKESSIWRMDYIGGAFVYRFSKVLGSAGAMSRNCIAEINGQHFVLTSNDCIVHDGQTSTSILDKQSRRELFRQIDPDFSDRCFVFVNRLYNEVFVCYPSLGNVTCNKALVWNLVDKTVSFRDIPSLNHGASGAVEDSSGSTWASDPAPWDSDTTVWDSNSSSLTRELSVVASETQKLFLLDSGATFNGGNITSFLERVGLSFGAPDRIKLISRIRPRIYGAAGGTVNVQVGYSSDPYSFVTYSDPVPFVIGSDVSVDVLCSGRYLAVKYSTGTALMWRLDSYDIEVKTTGAF